MNKQIICILGRVCSGKNTFADKLVNHTQIDIGQVVREITKTNKRIHNKDLDKEIIRALEYRFCAFSETKFVITGIRQLSVLLYVLEHYIPADRELIYLEVPEEELKRRYINRQSEKDRGIHFEDVIKRDNDLGLGEIEEFLKQEPELFTIIKNY